MVKYKIYVDPYGTNIEGIGNIYLSSQDILVHMYQGKITTQDQKEKVEIPTIMLHALNINKNSALCARNRSSEGRPLQFNTI